jgi:exoribonuclease R
MEFYPKYLEDLSSDFEIGHLINDNDIYYVNQKEVINNRGLHNDIVYLKNQEVIGIKERTTVHLVGILYLNTNVKYGFTKKNIPYYKFSPISQKYPDFIVPSKHKIKEKLYCVISFNKWEVTNKSPIGQIESMIGPIGLLSNEIYMLLYRTSIYPKKKKIEYLTLPSSNEKPEYNTFSIDPEGCKDIDDALHYKTTSTGYEIGIHIANVARYLKSINTNIFSSIYLEDSQINMISDQHSFNICSLGHHENKRALSLILKYTKENELVSYKFKETIIYNNTFSYQEVDKICHTSESKLNPLQLSIKNLYDFTKLIKVDTGSSTSMVEYYMLLYNIITAKVLYQYNNHTILRTHKVNSELKSDTTMLSKYLNKISQNAALYQINPEHTQHQGLDTDYYTHATSPIRRYVDIINQKNIINYLNSEDIIIESQIDEINYFSKKLRKFNNLYNKLNLIFKMKTSEIYDAFIISIQKNRVKVFIPDLEIEHKFTIISSKLLETNTIVSTDEHIEINELKLNLYQKIKINLTSLKHEDIFDKKLHIEVLEPRIPLV